MEEKVIVQARIKVETLKRIREMRRVPRRRWGHRHVPEYFGSFIDEFVNTKEFEILELRAQIERLRGQAAATEMVKKFKIAEIEHSKNAEIEGLRRQIIEMKAVIENT